MNVSFFINIHYLYTNYNYDRVTDMNRRKHKIQQHCGLQYMIMQYTNLSFAAYTTVESCVWYTLLLVDDIIEETNCLTDVHTLQTLGGLTGVL